jgi:protein SCO1/2
MTPGTALRPALGTLLWSAAALFCALPGRSALAQQPAPASDPAVGFDQRLSEALPLDVVLRDEQGQEVPVRQFFKGRPVILTPVYYKCPMLCGLELNGLVRGLRGLQMSTGMVAGKDFDIVTYSIDPREKPALAEQKRKQYLAQYGAEGIDDAWHFLTGDEASVKRLSEAIGFRAKFDEATGQYVHAAGIVLCTPEGTISRYLFGVEFAPRDLRLAVLESSAGKIGSLADHVLMFCYRYDPAQGKYGLAILNLLRLSGAVTVIVLGTGIGWMLKREKALQRRRELLTGGTHA